MPKPKKQNQTTIIIGLTLALIFITIGVFGLTHTQEILDKKAEELGLKEQPIYNPPFPNYNLPNLENQWSTLIISTTTTLLLFAITVTLAKLLNKKKANK
ncbi:MAG: hypothetical protein LBQ98_02170 [Nitrososphaerota archaeon]|jgi:hypothetical protein|nr:hypothetical protein [Nitrososphaerota archaeon]